MKRFASFAFAAALLVGGSARAFAQSAPADPPADPPAHISIVDGVASLERDGRPDPAPESMPLLSGDRLRTENGRVEVMFGDGATLHLDTSTTVDFQSDEVLRLLAGRVRLIIPGPSRQVSYRIDSPSGWVQVQEPGEYRVSLTRGDRDGDDVELVVLRGAAALLNDDGQTALRAGERAFATAGKAPSYPYVYNSAAWDAFDRWSEDRRGQRAGVSAQYLPDTVRPYASTFDRYGSWQYDDSYGYVWYPAVNAGWRPYYNGRWASFPSLGWTWIGGDSWAWPTHHYGRWGLSGSAWFWIPGRTWAPAWVSWAYAPDYVSWCPLGWDNRAVVGFASVNYRGRYDPWNAWTVVSRQRFGAGFVNVNVIHGSRIDVRTRNAFVVRQSAPESRGAAVPRGSAPIYAAGTRRGSSGFAGTAPGSSAYSRRPGVQVGRTAEGRTAPLSGDRPNAQVGRDAQGRTAPLSDTRPDARIGRDAQGRTAPLSGRPNAQVGRDVQGRASTASGRPDRQVGREAVARPNPGATPSRAAADDDAAAAFRSRRPSAVSSSPGYPAAARTPRDSADVIQRMGAPRERTSPPPSPEVASIPVHRGAVPRQAADPQTGRADDRLEVPGYRRAAPSSAQAPSPGYGGGYPGSAVGRGGRPGPERQPNDSYRAVPRQAPESSSPPPNRSYGGAERRSERSGPPPSAAPSREPGSRSSGGAPRSEGGERSRPSGQEHGSAVRRPGGRG